MPQTFTIKYFFLTKSPTLYASINFQTPYDNPVEMTGGFWKLPQPVNSIEIPIDTVVTLFDGPNYTGANKTYDSNVLNIAAVGGFTSAQGYIIQYSKVPYIDVGVRTDPENYIIFSDDKLLNGKELVRYKKGTYNNLSLTNIQSIQISEGHSVKITDDKNKSMTFYHHVFFLDAFGFTKDSVITSVTVDYVNYYPSCSINDDIEEFMLSPALITLIVSLFCTFAFLMVASSLSS